MATSRSMEQPSSLVDRLLAPRVVYALTFIVVALVGTLHFLPKEWASEIDVSVLPTINALLNATAAILLVSAFIAIRYRRITIHRNLMLTALMTSVVFLLLYTVYHTLSPGPTLYTGQYPMFYRSVLFSHIILAVIILPMALFTVRHGLGDRRMEHRKLARWTFPLWLYVSVTGVLIYGMLYL